MHNGVVSFFAAALVFACVACGQAQDESITVRRAFAPVDFQIIGTSDAEASLLREIADRTNPAGLSAISLEDAPSEVDAFTVEGTRWLRFDYDSPPADQASVVERYWRTGLISVAYRRAAAERGLPLVRGWTVADQTFQISADPYDRAAGHPDLDPQALVDRLRNERSDLLSVISLEVTHPSQWAARMVFETSDPTRLFCGDEDDLAVAVSPGPDGDGYLIRLVDSSGQVVWVTASVAGAGNSMSWAIPEFGGEEPAACKT
jgi:hypothetical protein